MLYKTKNTSLDELSRVNYSISNYECKNSFGYDTMNELIGAHEIYYYYVMLKLSHIMSDKI